MKTKQKMLKKVQKMVSLIHHFVNDASEGGDGYAVVGDGDVLRFGLCHATHHESAVKHTCTAMYHKVILR